MPAFMSGENLDARVLRFRNDPGSEAAGSLAIALLDAERAREALEVAGVHLRAHPQDAGMLVVAGRAWMARGDLLRAQKTLLQAARAGGNSPEPYRWLGEVLLRRGDPERAEKVLLRAKKLGAGGAEIDRLHERARRLAKIAGGTDDAPTQEQSVEPAGYFDDDDDEPTKVAQDLSRRLAEAGDPFAEEEEPTAKRRAFDEAPTSVPKPPVRARKRVPLKKRPRPAPQPAVDSPFSYGMGEPSPFDGPAPAAPAPPPLAPPQPPPMAVPEPDPFDDATKPADRLPGGPPLAPSPLPSSPPAPTPAPVVEPAPEPQAPDPFHVSVAKSDRESDGLGDMLADALEPTLDPGPPPADAPDLQGGESAGRAESVDRILSMLKDQHLFEPPNTDGVVWAAGKDARKLQHRGTKVGMPLGVLGVLALLLAGGGYFGYLKWVEHQEAQAAAKVAEAQTDALRGDHRDLVDAERLIRQARELHPLDTVGPELLLIVHAQRALEDGSFEPGYLRPTVERAREQQLGGARTVAAQAIVALASGETEDGEAQMASALQSGADDPHVLYIIGRLKQRQGDADAIEHLDAAIAAEPGLAAAGIAKAETLSEDGQPEAALEALDAVLARYEDHLRATLWRTYLRADEEEPEAALTQLATFDERMEDEGAPTDKVLIALTRARLHRRLGQTEQAEAAVEAAGAVGATEPRLQALVASSAQALGQLARAQTAAMAAVSSAPGIPEYRKLLAEILLERRDGVRALRVLGPLSNDDPSVLALSAEAALLVGGTDTLTATAQALTTYIEAHEDASVKMKALRIRVAVRMGSASEVYSQARSLARENEGDPDAGLALASAAIATGNARAAQRALEDVVAASPENAEAFYLLGRANRLGGDADEAEVALRRALELQSTHTEARSMLGQLLLDQGKYEEADTLYAELASRVGRSNSGRSFSLIGRLGRVQALLGQGKLDDAKVQLENIRREDRELAMVKVVQARVAITDGEAGDAVAALRPLAGEGATNPEVIALFGEALYAANQVRAAGEAFERALEIDGGLPEALLGFAEVLARGGKFRDAGEILERAESSLERRVRPPRFSARVLTLRGRIAVENGEDATARRLLRQAIETEAAPADAHFWLGEALAGSDSPAARESYERYLEIAPAGRLARRARSAIRSR